MTDITIGVWVRERLLGFDAFKNYKLYFDSLSLTGLSEYCEIPRIQSYRMKMQELDSILILKKEKASGKDRLIPRFG